MKKRGFVNFLSVLVILFMLINTPLIVGAETHAEHVLESEINTERLIAPTEDLHNDQLSESEPDKLSSELGVSHTFLEPPDLSEDSNTLYNAAPPIVLLVDPNPEMQNLRFPQTPDIKAAIAGDRSSYSSFQITYKPAGTSDPFGANCQTFPSQARAAFNAAAAIWASELQSSVPITISACWSPDIPDSLAYAAGVYIFRDFPGAPKPNTWYEQSLANALSGVDRKPGEFDMHITYNSRISWYYGTNANPPSNQIDFVSVALHEIAHGLNFGGSANRSDTGVYSWGWSGFPEIYDTFMESGTGTKLTSLTPGSSALGNLLTSNNLWWNGTHANAANGGSRVKMYAPSTWIGGSSYHHLDYNTFAGTINSLMVPSIAAGSANHNIGPVIRGILKDMGWSFGVPDLPPQNYTLTVTKAGNGNGTVTSTPAGINCGATCSASFASGTSVTLSASPLAGSIFSGWSGACSGTSSTCTVIMTQAQSVTATFNTTTPSTTFADVPTSYWAYDYIESLYQAGITGGCANNPLRYCPEDNVTRAEMAIFILRGMYGGGYQPPVVGVGTGFFDVPSSHWAARWIKQLAAEGVTTGCGDGNYCPENFVSRDQMAVFILRGIYGGSYQPPGVGASTGFSDVPTNHWAAPWIKQLAAEGITTGCGGGNYCPNGFVTRAQMAVFLVRAFIESSPPTDPPPSNPIRNGDFTAGPDGNWIEYSSSGWDLIMHSSKLPIRPHSGLWAAWLGGYFNEVSRLSQTVSIPTDMYYLHFYFQIRSEDDCGKDFARLLINDSTFHTFDLCQANHTSWWVRAVANLSAYKGTIVTIHFEVTTDDNLFSSFFLDSVSMSSSSSAPIRDTVPEEIPFNNFQKSEVFTPQ